MADEEKETFDCYIVFAFYVCPPVTRIITVDTMIMNTQLSTMDRSNEITFDTLHRSSAFFCVLNTLPTHAPMFKMKIQTRASHMIGRNIKPIPTTPNIPTPDINTFTHPFMESSASLRLPPITGTKLLTTNFNALLLHVSTLLFSIFCTLSIPVNIDITRPNTHFKLL